MGDGDPSAREELAHVPAIEKLEEENELGLHIIELGLEPEESIVSEENLDIIDQKLSGLKPELNTYISGYNVDLPEEYLSEMEETPVKQSKELTKDIEEFIEKESIVESIDSEDIIMYIGDFRSEFGDYVGDSHSDSNSGAIANKSTDAYTMNQVLHNTGHKLSLPHTLGEDVMTWSFYKALTAPLKVFGYHKESRENLEKSVNYHLEE